MAQIGNTTVLPSLTLGTPLPEASGGTGASTVLAATKTALNASGSAPIYGCRGWCTFTGSTAVIAASGNVTSITRNSAGNYTCVITTAMPDTNYCVQATSSAGIADVQISSTTTFTIRTYNDAGTSADTIVYFAIFR